MNPLLIKIVARILLLPVVVWLLILLPAGTLDYWQVYAYFGGILLVMVAVTPWFLKHSPEALEERMEMKETERPQKLIIAVMALSVFSLYLVAGFDKRFTWSAVPDGLALLAILVAVARYGGMTYVMKINSHASRVVKVDEDQELIDTGLYARVRHPMYSAAMLMFISAPIALASWWALVPALIALCCLVPRILNEESVLKRDLKGYTEYIQRVRWRVLPGIW